MAAGVAVQIAVAAREITVSRVGMCKPSLHPHKEACMLSVVGLTGSSRPTELARW